VITWLRFLQANYPDYRHVTISPASIDALPIDGDVYSLLSAIVDDTGVDKVPSVPVQLVTDGLPLPNSVSIVLNLDIMITEADLILQEIARQKPILPIIPVPSIRQTPINKVSGKDRIFAIAFPTLYPTSKADFNTPRLRKVDLKDYARHLTCFYNRRFGRYLH
jgi:hypothetical protein